MVGEGNQLGNAAKVLEVTEETMALRVVGALRDDIVTMALKPGDVISESDIAGRYGVSRQPVRVARTTPRKPYSRIPAGPISFPTTPASSRVSRSAASSGVSPFSTWPLGKIQFLGFRLAVTSSTSGSLPSVRKTMEPAWRMTGKVGEWRV